MLDGLKTLRGKEENMAILKCLPAVKDYLWGGDRLKREWNIKSDTEIAAEAWMLSCHPAGPSTIAEGDYAGMTLPQALKALGPDALGTAASACPDFPLLIKLIDARDRLSIQVHPDDAYARSHGDRFGKTEMWVILDAAPDAFLYYGFRRPVTKEDFAAHIRANTLPEILNAVPVRPGDVFFIPPGTLHAIGAGILIAEIQQSSNLTYRVYDYDRRDAQGNPRDLHIDQALDVTICEPPKPQDFTPHLVKCPYFTVDRAHTVTQGTVDGGSFLSILPIDGEGEILLTETNEKTAFRRGDSLFIPAASGGYEITGDAEVLLTRLTV